jgi:hypothetical protein
VATLVLGISLTIIVTRWLPTPDVAPKIVIPPINMVNQPRPPSAVVIRELDDLKSNLQALSQDLVRLRRRAELLDERREAEALAHRFDRIVALNGP